MNRTSIPSQQGQSSKAILSLLDVRSTVGVIVTTAPSWRTVSTARQDRGRLSGLPLSSVKIAFYAAFIMQRQLRQCIIKQVNVFRNESIFTISQRKRPSICPGVVNGKVLSAGKPSSFSLNEPRFVSLNRNLSKDGRVERCVRCLASRAPLSVPASSSGIAKAGGC